MEIKILGSGCAKCERLEKLAREAADELGVAATFTKVEDMDAMMTYGVLTTPILVINEQVVSSGRVPHKAEIANWIRTAE